MDIRIDKEFKALIPPHSPEELAGLEASLKAEGCLDTLKVWPHNGKHILLDGHTRKEICDKHGIKYQTASIELSDRLSARIWIRKWQLDHRNLNTYQSSVLALGNEKDYAEQAKERQRQSRGQGQKKQVCQKCGASHWPDEGCPPKGQSTLTDLSRHERETRTKLAKEAGISTGSMHKVKVIEDKADEKTKEKLRQGETTINREYKIIRRSQQRSEAKKKANALPKDKYRVIYADPPWSYGDQLTEDYGSTKWHYDPMKISELCALSVKKMAADDAVLFLWVTSPILPECFDVIGAWGFKYKASFVWDKVKHNMGHYNSVRHEFLLICTRGSCLPDSKKLIDSVQSIERSAKHSQKPEEFRSIIDKLYAHGKRIELFQRGEVPKNWEAWGDQAGGEHV